MLLHLHSAVCNDDPSAQIISCWLALKRPDNCKSYNFKPPFLRCLWLTSVSLDKCTDITLKQTTAIFQIFTYSSWMIILSSNSRLTTVAEKASLNYLAGIAQYSDLVTGWTIGAIGVRFSPGEGATNFSLRHCVQNSSGAHPASYPMCTRGSLPGDLRGQGVRLTTDLHLASRLRIRGAIPPLLHMPSRRGA
jgi:hypothetical protein